MRIKIKQLLSKQRKKGLGKKEFEKRYSNKPEVLKSLSEPHLEKERGVG